MVVNQLAGLKKKKTTPSPTVYKPKKTPKITTSTPTPTSTINFGDVNPSTRNTMGYTGGGTFQSTTQSFTKPKPLKGNESFLMFGQGATTQEQQSPGFLEKRNDAIAQDFASKGLTSQDQIMTELMKYNTFATASEQDRLNTAQAISARIGQYADGGQNVDQYFQDTYGIRQVTPEEEGVYKDKARQDYLTNLQRGITVRFDRPKEDMQREFDLAMRNKDRYLEDTGININQQVEDIKRTAERNIAFGDKMGALKGFNRSSGYIQGLDNIKTDAQRQVSRLQDLWDRIVSGTEEDKKALSEEFSLGMKRAKEDFDYQYRSLLDTQRQTMNTMIDKYGLSSEKLTRALDDIDLDTDMKIAELNSQYITNANNVIKNMSDQLDLVTQQDQVYQLQFERTRNFLDQNDGENLTSVSYKQIDDLVNQGQLSPQDAQLYRFGISNKAFNTLKEYGVPTQEDVDFMINALEQGYTPFQVVSTLVQRNPNRYNTQSLGAQQVSQVAGFGPVDINNPSNYTMRTDRHNNPTAMTTDVAKTLGLKEGVDYVKGDAFPNNPNLFTARLLGDPIDTTIKALDTAAQASNKQAFFTQKGQQRWTYISMSDDEWLSMSPEQKRNTILGMYKQEGGSGVLAQGTTPQVSQEDYTAGPISAIGVPVAYERRIKNMVPATLMNSEIELQQLNDTIKSLYNSGTSPEEAVLTYLGVDITNDTDKPFAGELISIAKGIKDVPSNFYSNLSDFINKGQKDRAVSYVERLALEQAQKDNPDLVFSDAGTIFAVKQANNILNLVQKYESQFGPLTGKWNNLTKGVFGNKKAQELATSIQQAISKMRNDLVGSNITQGEKSAISELIPTLEETAETAKVKINNLKKTPLDKYNEARSYIGLPIVDENKLINRNQRTNLYQSKPIQASGVKGRRP